MSLSVFVTYKISHVFQSLVHAIPPLKYRLQKVLAELKLSKPTTKLPLFLLHKIAAIVMLFTFSLLLNSHALFKDISTPISSLLILATTIFEELYIS